MPCGYVTWRGLPPMNRVELRAKLVLMAVPWRVLEPTTKVIIVALVGLISCQVGRPEGVSWDRRMTQSGHAECNVEEDREINCVKVNGGSVRLEIRHLPVG